MCWARVIGPADSGKRSSQNRRRTSTAGGVQGRIRDRHGGHDIFGIAQTGGAGGALRHRGYLAANLLVVATDLRGRRDPGADQGAGRSAQRIARQIRRDLPRTAIGLLDIGTGVAEKPNHPKVEKCRAPGAPRMVYRFARRAIAVDQIAAIGGDIGQAGSAGESPFNPLRRRAHADAETVVLAHEYDGHGQVHRDAAGGVDRPHGGRMIGRSVAKAADHDGVVGGSSRHPQANPAVETEGQPHGFGRVRTDGRGLRRDRQGRAAEDLVAPAGNGFVARGAHPQKHVEGRRLIGNLHGPPGEKTARSVVQERRVRGAGGGRHRGIALVPRRTDGVVTAPPGPQLAGREVQVTAEHLRLEDRPRLSGLQLAQRLGRYPVGQRRQRVDKPAIEHLGRSHRLRHRRRAYTQRR